MLYVKEIKCAGGRCRYRIEDNDALQSHQCIVGTVGIDMDEGDFVREVADDLIAEIIAQQKEGAENQIELARKYAEGLEDTLHPVNRIIHAK